MSLAREEWLHLWGFEDGSAEADAAWEAKLAFVAGPLDPINVLPDIAGYQSPIDGKWVGSRSEHRDHMKRHGVIELGNERPSLGRRETTIPKAAIRRTIKDTVERMKSDGSWRER